MATATLTDDHSVLSELTEETKKSMPLLAPMTPVESREITMARNAIRRASLTGAPALGSIHNNNNNNNNNNSNSSAHNNNNNNSEDEEENALRSYISSQHASSRRASMSGPTVEIRRQGAVVQEFPGPHHNHPHNHQQSFEHGSSMHSSRSRKSSRRPSVKGGSNTNTILLNIAAVDADDGDGYGTDNESVISARSLQRRASLQQRRASLSSKSEAPPSSSGSSTKSGVTEILGGVCMVQQYSLGSGGEEEEDDGNLHHRPHILQSQPQSRAANNHANNNSHNAVQHQHAPLRRGGRRDSPGVYPGASASAAPPPERGVQRFVTGDSLTMRIMQPQEPPLTSSLHGDHAPRPVRRMSATYSQKELLAKSNEQAAAQQQQQQQQPAPAQRGVQRYGTNDSFTMASMAEPANRVSRFSRQERRPSQSSNSDDSAAPPQRGVQRYGTNDSMTRMVMQKQSSATDSGAPTAVVAPQARSRRGGRRGAAPEEEEKEQQHVPVVPPCLGNDDSDNSEEEDIELHVPVAPQRGVARFSTGDSVTMRSMRVNTGIGSPRRGKRGTIQGLIQSNPSPTSGAAEQPPPPQRGVARYATNDSVTMGAVKSGGTSPRRGKRAAVKNTSQTPADDEDLSDPDDDEDDKEDEKVDTSAPPQRGVARYATNDSVTMQAMRGDNSGKASPRRGKRPGVQALLQVPVDDGDHSDPDDGEEDEEEDAPKHAPPQRGVARYATNDSVTMQGMQANSGIASPRRGKRPGVQALFQAPADDEDLSDPDDHKEEDHKPAAPQRGVARYATNDSVSMQAMRDTSNKASPRRGKRPCVQNVFHAPADDEDISDPDDHEEKEEEAAKHAAPQRGVARYATNDSVTMQAMQNNAKPSPRRGKRTTTNNVHGPPADDEELSDPDEEEEVVVVDLGMDESKEEEETGDETVASHPPPERGVARYATNDSVTMQAMRDNTKATPRRGKRSSAQNVHEPPADDEDLSDPDEDEEVVVVEVEMDESEEEEEDAKVSAGGPAQRGVARYSTNDSVTMQGMRDNTKAVPRRGKRAAVPSVSQPPVGNEDLSDHDSHEQANNPAGSAARALPQRGVARYSTNDSVTMQAMQDNAAKDAQNPALSQRGFVRYATNDSVTMQAMKDNSKVSPRRGKRPTVQSMYQAPADDEDLSDPDDYEEEEEEEDHFQDKDIHAPQRGIARYATNDSVTMQAMREENKASPRRGKRPTVENFTKSPDVCQDPYPAEDTNDLHGPHQGEQALHSIVTPNNDQEPVDPVMSPKNRDTEYAVDYGYQLPHHDPRSSRHQSDNMLDLLGENFTIPTGSQTRRGSTGVLSAQNDDDDEARQKSFRRASTGQNFVDEANMAPIQSSKMGRRGSTGSVFTTRTEASHQANYTPSVASHTELRDTHHSFTGGAYLSKPNRQDNSDSDEEIDYGYGGNSKAKNMYGYGQTPQEPRGNEMFRRGSDLSLASRSSSIRKSQSMLRSSKGKELQQKATRMGSARRSSRPTNHQHESDSEDSTIHGYSEKDAASHRGGEDYMSESGRSVNSRSSRRSMRRNSVVILPDQVRKSGGGVGSGLLKGQDEMNDLMNNSAYLEFAIVPDDPQSILDSGTRDGLGAVQKPQNDAAPQSRPTHTLKSKDDPWSRATPFTTPRQSLTKEALETNLRASAILVEQPISKISMHKRTGVDESSADSSSDGGELYKDKEPAELGGFDEFNQRPRRRESLDKTCININEILENRSKEIKVPKFTPAVNCTNASDYIVRAFVARLRHGIPVIKHNRSRWSKSQQRELIILPDGKSLSWKAAEGEQGKTKRPKMDLLKCTEVRHAWSKDPDTRKKLGTGVLRSRCKDGSASKSFSLIFNKRTLDMTAMSTDSCKLMMEGFSALCFRLQLDKLQDDDHDNNDEEDKGSVCGDNARSVITDDDWASTVYESTTSVTKSNTLTGNTVAHSPWGV